MRIQFPPDLPVSARRDDIAEALAGHQVVIVAGETGSGKTTQLPKICLAMGRGQDAMIGHTQPRRIAARSVATRIAAELDTELGDLVGYQVRFTDRTSERSRVKVMTDGILLAELRRDRMLSRYDTVIIDEAHERSLNIDFLLGYLKRLLPRRPDLKVVVTSATIETGRFAEYFGDAPVVEVSGRTYPVDVRYRPLAAEPGAAGGTDAEGEVLVRDQTEAIDAAVAELCTEGRGDILVFLPGEREIRDAADVLARRAEVGEGFDVLPLFSRLSAAEQHRIFEQHARRRVVLATNVAETSLTVPGIRYVVDTGLARISRYSARTKVQRLPIEPVSQASADQRAGRCGRVEAGICIRLYAEEDYGGRPEFTDPEILRTNLASVILQMTALGLGDVGGFPFLDPPDRRNIRAGVQLLEEIGALRTGGADRTGRRAAEQRPRLTGTGRKLARLPLDPRLGRMVLEADRLGCLREVLVVVAALSIQDPRERPADQRAGADQLHARFRDPRSDFMAWLNLWQYLREQQRSMGSSAFRRTCRQELLNHLRVREWQELERQLRQLAREIGLHVSPRGNARAERTGTTDGYHEPNLDHVHEALLSGLLSHVGLRDRERRDYLGARGTRFAIFPGSGLHRKQPDFVMAAELVETSRLWGRQVAAVDPAWAERLGSHLVKRSLSEPHWSAKRAAAMARERVTLYGVPLVADRLVTLAGSDPELARELFIRHALVYGEWHTRHRFLDVNRRRLEEAEELEHRARRRGIVVDEHTLFDFYDAHIPDSVVSGAHFDSWWKQERRVRPDLLTFDSAMLVRDRDDVGAGDFPDSWVEGAVSLPLSYHFEPGSEQDGVTVEVPLATLNTLTGADFSWQVPGMREELVVALLRGLPKQLRVAFVPVPDTARAFLREVPPGEEPITEALARHLRARTGVHVPDAAWDWEAVPAHLRPTFRIVDGSGAEVARGKDLAVLERPLRTEVGEAIGEAAAGSDLTATGQTDWTFGTLPERFATTRSGHQVTGYPALVDEGGTVGLRVVGDPALAAAHHRHGVRRLLVITLPSPVPEILAGLDNAGRLAAAGGPDPTARDLLDGCVLAAADELLGDRPVRDRQAFGELVEQAGPELPGRTAESLRRALAGLDRWRQVDRLLQGRVDLPLLPAMADMQGQLGRLVHPGFVADAGPALRHLPRYLAAMAHRHEQLPRDPRRDRQRMDLVVPLQEAWQHRMDALPQGQPAPELLVRVRWMLEEYRVSLWAQHLGTPDKVSDARIRRLLGQ
ncbi:MAG: ATP-dependent RNA helicase HrpA [Marmoricola sp.]